VTDIVIREEAVESGELSSVSVSQLRKALRSLRDEPERGKPLTRALTGCRSIRIGGSENRLVYRYREDIDQVEVIAVGRRRANDVYDAATGRV
jgi:mRNA-degrading endonuclease RelE of RelBE toxin-antitoxin system